MIFKSGVVLNLQPEMAAALPVIDLAHEDAGLDRLAVITSGTDGQHMAGSLHYEGLAVDLRTRDLHPTTVYTLAAALRKRLNGDEKLNRPYQIVLEKDHIHTEYQPTPGA